MGAFHRFVEALLDEHPNRKLILLFDEYELFENKIDNGVITEDTLYILSSLMENHSVFLIFTGSLSLENRRREYWKIFLGKSIYRQISCPWWRASWPEPWPWPWPDGSDSGSSSRPVPGTRATAVRPRGRACSSRSRPHPGRRSSIGMSGAWVRLLPRAHPGRDADLPPGRTRVRRVHLRPHPGRRGRLGPEGHHLEAPSTS